MDVGAAGDNQCLSGDKVTAVTAQVGTGLGDIHCVPRSTHWTHREKVLQGFVAVIVEARTGDDSWRYGVHADVKGRPLDGNRPRQVDYTTREATVCTIWLTPRSISAVMVMTLPLSPRSRQR